MSVANYVPLLAILTFAGLVVWAAVTDIRTLLIPNRICVAIAMLYPAYVLSAPQSIDWIGALVVSAATLVVGFVLFLLSFRGSPVMGAGDTKLLSACALWAGPTLMFDLLFVMAMAGGVIAVYSWLRHRPAAAAATATGASVSAAATGALSFLRIPNILSHFRIPHVQLPYGLAICAGALYVAISLVVGV